MNGVPQPRTAAGELAYEERSDGGRRARSGHLPPLPRGAREGRARAARGRRRRGRGGELAGGAAAGVATLRRAPVPPGPARRARGAVRDRPAGPRLRARRQPRPLRRQPRRGRLAGAPRPRRRDGPRSSSGAGATAGSAAGDGGRAPRAAFQTHRVAARSCSDAPAPFDLARAAARASRGRALAARRGERGEITWVALAPPRSRSSSAATWRGCGARSTSSTTR